MRLSYSATFGIICQVTTLSLTIFHKSFNETRRGKKSWMISCNHYVTLLLDISIFVWGSKLGEKRRKVRICGEVLRYWQTSLIIFILSLALGIYSRITWHERSRIWHGGPSSESGMVLNKVCMTMTLPRLLVSPTFSLQTGWLWMKLKSYFFLHAMHAHLSCHCCCCNYITSTFTFSL